MTEFGYGIIISYKDRINDGSKTTMCIDPKQFDDLIFKITIFVFLFLLIIRYSLLLINNKKLIFNNLFYFILYLCALEIVPLVIILKLTI